VYDSNAKYDCSSACQIHTLEKKAPITHHGLVTYL
jgi:hypothetical protein